jgi:hypothetical protein
MITPKKMQLAIGLALTFTYASAIGSEPNLPKIELEFVTKGSLEYEIEFSLEAGFEKPPPIKPSFAAIFTVQWRFEKTNEPNASDLLRTSAGKTLSALQRELLNTEKTFWLDCTVSKTPMGDDPPFGSATYIARAVGEEDAKKMAYALVEFLIRDEKADTRRMKEKHIQKLSRMQNEIREKLENEKEQIENKSNEVPHAYQQYMDAVRNSPYSLHPSSQVPDEVRKTIFEMNKMLDVLNIEIAGIQSKLSAIRKYSSQREIRDSETLSTTLKEMAIRQEIELVGAESRRQAIMGLKRREEALYSQYKAYLDLKSEIATLEDSVEQDGKDLKRLDRKVNFLGPGERTFIIEGPTTRPNQVVLRQLRMSMMGEMRRPRRK